MLKCFYFQHVPLLQSAAHLKVHEYNLTKLLSQHNNVKHVFHTISNSPPLQCSVPLLLHSADNPAASIMSEKDRSTGIQKERRLFVVWRKSEILKHLNIL